MKECIFCKIGQHREKAWMIYETELSFAFLDIHPMNPYHTLVIPKSHLVEEYDSMLEKLGVGALVGVNKYVEVNYQIDLDEYKQQVADLYSRRSSNYDDGDWHPRIACRLVEYAQLSQGQKVLDIATGTGLVAIGFHAFAETAFVGGTVAQKVLEKYGVSLWFNQPTGTVEKCYDLLNRSGFAEIDIKVEPDGSYISLETAKGMWSGNGTSPIPGQHPNPLLELTADRLTAARLEFDRELEALQTDRGIWNDTTIFYAFGHKVA